MTDRHSASPKAVRMPRGLLAWYEQHAKVSGRSVNAALVGALEEYRAHHEGGSTTQSAPHERSSTTARKPRGAPAVKFRDPGNTQDMARAVARRRNGEQ